MSELLPAGRLSALDVGGVRIEIQTEFSRYPKRRIATSVSLKGKVLHKIRKDWPEPIIDNDCLQRAEMLINRQHDEVAAIVRQHGSTLLVQAERVKTPHSDEALLAAAEALPEIRRAFIVAADRVVARREAVTAEAMALGPLISGITNMVVLLSQTLKLGDAEDCVLHLGDEALLLVPCNDGYLGALTDVKTMKKGVLKKLWQVVKQK
jgi:predicted regulator of Ras-like GTPase activity (Roadblock/LC7/MglB family)